MQRKIHNQTLFVAALSVYLGLLIAGAPPQIVAQQSKFVNVLSQTKPLMNLGEIQNAEETPKQNKKLTIEFYAKLSKLVAAEDFSTPPTHFVVKTEFCNGSATNKQVITAEGHLVILDFLRQEMLRASSERQADQALTYDLNLSSILSDIEINQSEIINKSISTYVSENTAKKDFLPMLQVMLHQAQLNELRKAHQDQLENKEIVLDPFVMGLSISQINNQFLIITRLPRAGLDAFLTANEKAN